MNTEPLSGLERELLGHVRQLVETSDTSVQAFRDLEKRSTDTIERTLTLLSASITQLAAWQTALAHSLKELVNGSASYEQLDTQLVESLAKLQKAENKLSAASKK